jgi:hypothetical protein
VCVCVCVWRVRCAGHADSSQSANAAARTARTHARMLTLVQRSAGVRTAAGSARTRAAAMRAMRAMRASAALGSAGTARRGDPRTRGYPGIAVDGDGTGDPTADGVATRVARGGGGQFGLAFVPCTMQHPMSCLPHHRIRRHARETRRAWAADRHGAGLPSERSAQVRCNSVDSSPTSLALTAYAQAMQWPDAAQKDH